MCVRYWESYFPSSRRVDDGQPKSTASKALIYADEAQRIARFVCEYPSIETGGDLFGYWTHSGAPMVSYATGPGLGSHHYPTSFYQDADWLHDLGVHLYDQHGLQHVGEWHSHHQLGVNRPSAEDIRTVVRGMAAKNWSKFLLMIATLAPRPSSPVLQNYHLVYPNGRFRPLRIRVLDGGSPFRTGPEDPREEPILQPATGVHWRPGPMTPPARSVDVALPGAWFATEPGKMQFRQIAADFENNGLPCRYYLSSDGRGLRLSLPDAELLLGADFPASPPLVLAGSPISGLAWTPSTNLLEWYLSRQAVATLPHTPNQAGKPTAIGSATASPNYRSYE